MQALRDFWRFHFLKALLVLVVIQLGVVAWLQVRNHKPIAIVDEVTLIEGQSVKIQPLRNDSDKDEQDLDSLRIYHVNNPLIGEIEQRGKFLVYKAEYGKTGVDSFTYVITDGKKESKAAFIKVTVNKNLEPVASVDYVQMYVGNSVNIAVLSNDEDRERDSIFIHEFTQPLNGMLVKTGNEFTYTASSSKAMVDSFQYVISDGFNNSEKATVVIDVKDKGYSCYPWLNADIGNAQIQGSLIKEGDSFITKASGDDIWNSADGFNFTYQKVSGNCVIIAKIEKLENTNEWAKAGLIFRDELTAESKYCMAALTAQHGVGFQRRSETNGSSDGIGDKDGITAPYWIKLVRKDNLFTAYASQNGNNWEQYGSEKVELNKQLYVGLAHTSHDNNKLGEAIFSNVKIIK